MTIRDIANLANVSVSTVSKIINKKDESISEETRARVLDIVREHGYAPYRDRVTAQSHLVGVMLPAWTSQDLLSAVVERCKEHGYGAVVCTATSGEEELENAKLLRQHGVGGVLWFQSDFSAAEAAQIFAAQEIPVTTVSESEETDITLPWGELGSFAANIFSEHEHQQIGCVLAARPINREQLLAGMNTILMPKGCACTWDDFFQLTNKNDGELSVWLQEHTAVLCGDEAAAERVLITAERLGYRVPNDLSVLLLRRNHGEREQELSAVLLPYFAAGTAAVEHLLAQIQERPFEDELLSWTYTLNHDGSIACPRVNGRKKIIVVGTINSDTLISVKKYPELGETVTAQGCFSTPGGKGLNQAVAVSRLEADAYLIAKVGKDYEGRTISAFLKSSHVMMDGISAVDDVPTGKAYIFTQSDAESSISVLKGANALLTSADLTAHASLFEGASYCLLQTETDVDVVEQAMDLAHQYGVKTILKPCAVERLTPELVRKTDILIPNQKEAAKLLPESSDVEMQAAMFFRMGAKDVIITMGHNGCYWYSEEQGRYFPAADIEAIDTTGAADAFIAALAVSLSEGRSMELAIRYATIAAGLSTTRYGVSAAATDKNTLELYAGREGIMP